jgi:hypothetical protein
MSINNVSRSVIAQSRVTLLIVAPLTDDFIGVIYARNMFIVQTSGVQSIEIGLEQAPFVFFKLIFFRI